jgi:hypothetical protein
VHDHPARQAHRLLGTAFIAQDEARDDGFTRGLLVCFCLIVNGLINARRA